MARPKKISEIETAAPKSEPGKLVKELRKVFGKEEISWDLSTEDSPTAAKTFISTGSTLLDYAISNRRNGGVPTGKLTEIAGEEASGKSLIISHVIANTQKKGGLAVLLDTENAASPDFMEQVGVDLDSLIYLQPATIEKTFETIEKTVAIARTDNADCPIVIAWDGVAATPPQSEIEGDYDPNSRIGVMAKTLAKGLRKLTSTVGREKITLVVTNQLKQKPGLVYGDPFYTPGGKAIPYHASVRIRLTSSTKLKDGNGAIYAISTKGKCIKTRLGPPHRSCKFDIHFDHGIDDVYSWFTFFHDIDLVKKAGGWCTFPSSPLGEEKFREKDWRNMIATNPVFSAFVLDELERRLVIVYKDLNDREAIVVNENEGSDFSHQDDDDEITSNSDD